MVRVTWFVIYILFYNFLLVVLKFQRLETCSHDLRGLGFIIKICDLKEVQETPELRSQASESWKIILQTIAAMTCHKTKQHWSACLQSMNSLLPFPHVFSFSSFLPFVHCSVEYLDPSIHCLFSSLFLICLLLSPLLHPILHCSHLLGNHIHLCLMYIFCFVHVFVKEVFFNGLIIFLNGT